MKTNDMTKCNPIKVIIMFMIPLFIGNIFQQVYNIVDTMVAGHFLGDKAIAAIGATGTLYGLLVNFAWGMNNGFGIIVARFFGAKDEDGFKKSVAAMVVLDMIITVTITVCSIIFLKPMLRAISVPESIFDDAYSYIFIIFIGTVAAMVYNMAAGILTAMGNSKTPLYFLIFSSLLNLVLDILCVVTFGLGIKGAAIATVISQIISAILSSTCIIKKYKSLLPCKVHFKPEGKLISDMLTTGGAMAFMVCIVDLGSVFYQKSINDLGDKIITAHTAARKIISMIMMPMASLGSAYSTFVSQNWGAKEYKRIEDSLKKILLMEACGGVVACAFIWIFGTVVVKLLTGSSDMDVISNAVFSIRLHFVFFPMLGILLTFRTALQAMGEKIVPMVSSGFELVAKILAAFLLIPKYGFLWVCLIEPIIWTVCVIFLIVVFLLKQPVKKAINFIPQGEV